MGKKLKFARNDKVFAKVRGYPPWPAKIKAPADETPNKMRYHVYFYGTAETAVVKAEDICPYIESKERLKKRKHKNYAEAVEEIEKDMTPEELKALRAIDSENAAKPDKDESKGNLTDLDESTVSEDSPKSKKEEEKKETPKAKKEEEKKETPKPKKEEEKKETPKPGVNRRSSNAAKPTPKPVQTPQTKPKPKEKKAEEKAPVIQNKRKRQDAEDTPEKPIKKVRQSSVSSSAEESTPMDLNEPEESNEAEAVKEPKPKETKTAKESPSKPQEKEETAEKPEVPADPKTSPEVTSRSGRKIKPKRFVDFDEDSPAPKAKEEKKVKEAMPEFIFAKDNKIKIPLRLNRPVFDSARYGDDWDEMVLAHANALKKKVESGEFKEDVEEHMWDWTSEKASEITKQQTDDKTKWLNTEVQILDADFTIKSALSLKHPDPKKCIKSLNNLEKLAINALMLKKHPDIVTTIMKVRKYVGNVRNWTMTPEEAEDFQEMTVVIRNKADHIYNKFKSLFLFPEGRSFWAHFSEELETFSKKTKNMTLDEIFAIMEEK